MVTGSGRHAWNAVAGLACTDPFYLTPVAGMQVEVFLRSPEQEKVFSDFDTMSPALQWADTLVPFGEPCCHFQAITVARNELGKGVSVRLTKTPDKNDQRKAQYNAEAAELAELRALAGA